MQTKPIETSGAKYRWTYEVSLFRNPGIFLLVAKVLFGTILGMGIVIMLPAMLAMNGFHAATFAGWLKNIGAVLALFAVLLVLGYLLYAAVMGGKYVVDFTMDDRELVHAQSADQAKKAKKIGTAAAVMGALAKNRGAVSAGMASQRTVSTTEFSRVKKVVVIRRRSVIKLIGGGANEAYADGDDFDFAADWIRAHVPPDVKWVEK